MPMNHPKWVHDDYQKRYLWLTSPALRKFSDAKPTSLKIKISKLLFHATNALKAYIAKSAFFCTRLRIQLHPKGRLLSLIIFYFLIYWFANFVCKESRNLSPFGKVAILGLDINQRTLNLKFSWPFFLTRWPAAGLLGCVPPLWPLCHYSAWTLSRCVLNDFWRPCLWLYFFFSHSMQSSVI